MSSEVWVPSSKSGAGRAVAVFYKGYLLVSVKTDIFSQPSTSGEVLS